jgi:CRP/FNR family cyclic AMP-dependent transcriptional regulator
VTKINLFKSSTDATTVDAGTVLFREGETGDVMYAVVEGEVELTRVGLPLESVTAGGIIGELALIDESPRAATATASTVARVVPIDRKSFTYLVQEHPTFALSVMTIMAERLRNANSVP